MCAQTGGLGARKLGGKQTLGASRLAPTRATANPDAVLGSFEDAERAAAAEAAAAAKRQEDEDFAIAVALAEQDANVAMARSLSVCGVQCTAVLGEVACLSAGVYHRSHLQLAQQPPPLYARPLQRVLFGPPLTRIACDGIGAEVKPRQWQPPRRTNVWSLCQRDSHLE